MNSGTKESCTCSICVNCCVRNPGWFAPEEAMKAIDAGFADKMMLDWWEKMEDEEGRIYILCPASSGHQGNFAPEMPFSAIFLGGWSKGTCTLLKDGKCTIHDTGFKPLECRSALTCQDETGEDDRDNLVQLWNTDRGREIVEHWKKAVGLVSK